MKPHHMFFKVILPSKSIFATAALYSVFTIHFSLLCDALNTFTVFVNKVELKFALRPGTRSRG